MQHSSSQPLPCTAIILQDVLAKVGRWGRWHSHLLLEAEGSHGLEEELRAAINDHLSSSEIT